MWTFFALACALHIGRPEVAPAGFTVAQVVAPAIEPGLRDDLASGLARALASRGALGGAKIPVVLQVLDADTATAAAAEGAQVRVARLRVAVSVLGPRPRRVVLSGERGYTITAGASLEASEARAGAFAALADALMADAADWILYAPEEHP